MNVNEEYSKALWLLRDLGWKNGKGEYCWCDMRIGSPMAREHSAVCQRAQKWMKDNA